ncbi:alpha/beta fold hydrolase [Janthinobacterium sp. NFX145]|uniref:alpha/beta fold hydrolase n=1 Tax=Janthinobacterium sp. NFX145 TaxID=3415602 RepID=UPI003CC58365
MDEARSVGRATIVLVHGGFVDGSGCEGVYRALCEERCHVDIVQNTTLSLEDYVVTTQRVMAASPDPVVLIGHSYGGVVVTQAGSDSKVKALVYLAALVPNHGEAVDSLLKNAPPAVPVPPILPPHDGFLLLDQKSLRPPSPRMCPGARPTPWRHRKCPGEWPP